MAKRAISMDKWVIGENAKPGDEVAVIGRRTVRVDSEVVVWAICPIERLTATRCHTPATAFHTSEWTRDFGQNCRYKQSGNRIVMATDEHRRLYAERVAEKERQEAEAKEREAQKAARRQTNEGERLHLWASRILSGTEEEAEMLLRQFAAVIGGDLSREITAGEREGV